MKHVTGIAIAASALVMLSGCHRWEHHHGHHADAAAIEKQIRAIETQWNADYNTHNVDALAAHYADDAALANPGVALATDAAARRAGLTQFIADPSLKVQFASDRVLVAKSGDLVTSRGHYTSQTTDPATKQTKSESGTYLTVYRKQADGSWKAIEDAIIPGAPAAAG
jgi:ketosteroid isomerase-like protein